MVALIYEGSEVGVIFNEFPNDEQQIERSLETP